MFRLQGLLLFFALLVGVFGAQVPFKCHATKAHIRTVNHAFAFPKQMCHWYNAAARHVSPLSTLSSQQFTAACACINNKRPSTKPYSHPPPANFHAKCDDKAAKQLRHIAKKQPLQFCQFWGAGLKNFRAVSPFAKEGLTNVDIYNACACVKASASAKASAASSTTTDGAFTTGTGEIPPATSASETASNTEAPAANTTDGADKTSKPTDAAATSSNTTDAGQPTEKPSASESASETAANETASETSASETSAPTP